MSEEILVRVKHYLEVANKHSDLNAFISTNDIEAIKMAKESDKRISNGIPKSDIDGIIVAIKDNIHVAGLPNTAGTPALRDFTPIEDAPIVKKLLSAGIICIGKLNMHEMAFGVTSYNYAFHSGQVGVRNAFDHNKIAGGSSGGSAVAVAMKMCDVALGSDTGGSVRIPAALNGVVGFRPSMNRYSNEGITPISHTRDTAGILARSVHDVQRVDEIIANDDDTKINILETIRLGYDESRSLANCSDDVIAGWKMALEKLRKDKRITLVEIDIKQVYKLHGEVNFPIVAYEAYHDLISYLKKYDTGVTLEKLVDKIASPDVKEIYKTVIIGDIADKKPAYDNAISIRPHLIDVYETLFAKNTLDAIIAPTTPIPAVDATPQSVFPDDVSSAPEKFIW